MGKRDTLFSCAASLGLFALGATLGAHRTRRRLRRPSTPRTSSPCPSPPTTPPAPSSPPSDCAEAPLPPPLTLDCPVCLGELVLPRVAPCGHTLCSPCLRALFAHERRPACPVCRRRIRVSVDKLPVNFMLKACVDARVADRGHEAWRAYRRSEEEARAFLTPFAAASDGSRGRAGVVSQLRPAWNWFKWTVIIVTEFGAFLVSLKEVLESAPTRSRQYQRIV